MAKLASIALLLTIACLLASTQDVYARKHGHVTEEEELVNFQLYVHIPPLNTTAYEVARASITDTSPTRFGSVIVFDDLVTADPDPNSPQLARFQGLLTFSDLSVFATAFTGNFYFTGGNYAGNTLAILGRSQFSNDEREVVVAGGTGSFRFAHGYAIQTTESMASDYAIESTYFIGNGFLILKFDVFFTYTDKCIPSPGV